MKDKEEKNTFKQTELTLEDGGHGLHLQVPIVVRRKLVDLIRTGNRNPYINTFRRRADRNGTVPDREVAGVLQQVGQPLDLRRQHRDVIAQLAVRLLHLTLEYLVIRIFTVLPHLELVVLSLQGVEIGPADDEGAIGVGAASTNNCRTFILCPVDSRGGRNVGSHLLRSVRKTRSGLLLQKQVADGPKDVFQVC